MCSFGEGFVWCILCVRFFSFFFFALLRIPAGLFVPDKCKCVFFLSWTFSELLDGV